MEGEKAVVALLLQALVTGLLMGGVYAAYSSGFSLIFGVMNIVNIFHGELIMIGAFTTYWLFTLYHVDPFLTLPVSILSASLLGYVIQRFLINRVVEAPPMMSYLCTFGIHLILANLALLAWSADFRTVTTSYSGEGFSVGPITVPLARLATFGIAIVTTFAIYWFLEKNRHGKAIRAASQDKEMARLVGIDIRKVYALTFALGAGITGMAGGLISTYFVIYPQMGLPYTITAFCVVVLGGMGYIPGALVGGLLLGIIQSLTATYLTSGLSVAITFILLFIILILKPQGIMGRGAVE
ncbi:MAG TPA: branched-chain amino acid ABC transporter permease [Syntrophorhabdales bacterium]|nr:branched-chain amino acid ABC transporter permease [Syntrophorhabdales bacterium]